MTYLVESENQVRLLKPFTELPPSGPQPDLRTELEPSSEEIYEMFDHSTHIFNVAEKAVISETSEELEEKMGEFVKEIQENQPAEYHRIAKQVSEKSEDVPKMSPEEARAHFLKQFENKGKLNSFEKILKQLAEGEGNLDPRLLMILMIQGAILERAFTLITANKLNVELELDNVPSFLGLQDAVLARDGTPEGDLVVPSIKKKLEDLKTYPPPRETIFVVELIVNSMIGILETDVQMLERLEAKVRREAIEATQDQEAEEVKLEEKPDAVQIVSKDEEDVV